MKTFTYLRLALLLLTSVSDAFVSLWSRSGAPKVALSATQEERDSAIAEYLESTYDETLQAILQLEKEKEKQIQIMRMTLYENLNVALREKEMEAMRLKLESLKQMIEERLEFQVSMEAIAADLKAIELQDLRIRLQELLDKKKRLDLEEKRQKKMQYRRNSLGVTTRNGVEKKNGVKESKKKSGPQLTKKVAASVIKSAPKTKNTIAPKAKSGTQLARKVVPGVIKSAQKPKNGVAANPTIRLGPFTPRD